MLSASAVCQSALGTRACVRISDNQLKTAAFRCSTASSFARTFLRAFFFLNFKPVVPQNLALIAGETEIKFGLSEHLALSCSKRFLDTRV